MNGVTEEKKEVIQLTSGKAAGQLKKSITNVATLPTTPNKFTESIKNKDAEE